MEAFRQRSPSWRPDILKRARERRSTRSLSAVPVPSSSCDDPTPAAASSDSPVNTREAETDALNCDLDSVAAVFPDVRPEVFRELLLSFSGESRRYLVTEALLMNKPKVVRGRWRVTHSERDDEGDDDDATDAIDCNDPSKPLVPLNERFRSDGYKAAVQAALFDEFRSLSRSAIKAVLAEQNYSYTNARPLLLQVTSQTWASTFFGWFSRRKAPSISEHPLVSWEKAGDASVPAPILRSVCDPELEHELDSSLLAPLRAERAQVQLDADAEMAADLHEAEAEAENATFDCQCCFTSSSFERIAVCSDKGHYLCYRCLRHTMSEALYGQGWSQSVDSERSTLRCVAPDSESGSTCKGVVPKDLVRAAVCSDKAGDETWLRFEDKLVNDSLGRSGLELLKCPFCPYAEVGEKTPTLPGDILQRILHNPFLALILLATFLIAAAATYYTLESLWLHREAAGYLAALLLPTIRLLWTRKRLTRVARARRKLAAKIRPYTPRPLAEAASAIAKRVRRSSTASTTAKSTESLAAHNKGRKFICQSPRCGARSCLTCRARWADAHECFGRQATSLRTHVEAALTAATKRTCPLCGLSFVKADGCNKLECPCGYRMCYLCRRDVRRVGYQHFCPHFRASGAGPCPERCGRCDLYKDDDVELDVVKRRAEEEWWQLDGRRRGLDESRDLLGASLDGMGSVREQPAGGKGVKGKGRWAFFG